MVKKIVKIGPADPDIIDLQGMTRKEKRALV